MCLGDIAGDDVDECRQGEQAEHGNGQDLERGVGDFEMGIHGGSTPWGFNAEE